MAKVNYTGIGNPQAAFLELRPYRLALIALKSHCRPFGPDYLALQGAQQALDAAAHHFTGDPEFYSLKPEQSKYGGR